MPLLDQILSEDNHRAPLDADGNPLFIGAIVRLTDGTIARVTNIVGGAIVVDVTRAITTRVDLFGVHTALRRPIREPAVHLGTSVRIVTERPHDAGKARRFAPLDDDIPF